MRDLMSQRASKSPTRPIAGASSRTRRVVSEGELLSHAVSPQFSFQSFPVNQTPECTPPSSPQAARAASSFEPTPFSNNLTPLFVDEPEISGDHSLPAPEESVKHMSTGQAEEATNATINAPDSPLHLGQIPPLEQQSERDDHQDLASLYPEADDSLDRNDFGFSQEVVDTASESSRGSSTTSAIERVVSTAEVHSLFSTASDVSNYYGSSAADPGNALCEDIYSRIFYDFDDERFTRCLWEDILEEENRVLHTPVSQDELEARVEAQQQGGLEQWSYDSPFCDVEVRIDDVNDVLEKRFLVESNTVLDNVISEISSKSYQNTIRDDDVVNITPLTCVKTFISECLLEKLRCFANRVLHQQRKKLTTANELLGLLILHTLCASYDESPTTVCDKAESENFFQMGIAADRYHEVWAALSGTKDRRGVHDYSATGWCRSANRTTSMITEVEAETAAINRELLYIPNATVLSLDDDHLRMASRSVTELTYLQQHNNPKKGLGPVENALCSALNPFFIAFHFTRSGEKLLHTWERLMQLLQGASTTGALRHMPDAIVAADRGYNSKESIAFVSNVLGASLIGTHKRDLWFPYVFGDGPISRRHRGMVVSERGCRAVYSARLKGSSSRQERVAEACLYRESCSGRIAAMVHNNTSLFPSRCFTAVVKEAFRSLDAVLKVQDSLQLYDDDTGVESGTQHVTRGRRVEVTAKDVVDQLLRKVFMLTYLQSEDPVWFLLRAFRFTSRTGHSFLAAVARDFDRNMKGLGSKLAGSRVSAGADPLPVDTSDAVLCIKDRWDTVLSVLGMRKQAVTQPNSRRTMAEQIDNYSSSRIGSFNKTELQRILGVFGRQLDTRAPKALMVSAVLQLQTDIRDKTVDLKAGGQVELRSEAEVLLGFERGVCEALREASLGAWFMKPLVSTIGMKEGTRNEIEILKAFRGFLANQDGAYARPVGTTTFL